MSTLLQILKPSKGYSNTVRDPWKMSRTVHNEANLWTSWANVQNTTNNIFYTQFQNANDPRRDAYILGVSSANTWQTLADITNPKGGYLRWIMLPTSSNSLSNTVECRITVDGREYNFDYTNSYSADYYRPFIGNIKPGYNYNAFSDPFSYYSEHNTTRSNNYDIWVAAPADGQWVSMKSDATVYNEVEFKYITQLRYESNIKVEVKMSVLTADFHRNYALANISATP